MVRVPVESPVRRLWSGRKSTQLIILAAFESCGLKDGQLRGSADWTNAWLYGFDGSPAVDSAVASPLPNAKVFITEGDQNVVLCLVKWGPFHAFTDLQLFLERVEDSDHRGSDGWSHWYLRTGQNGGRLPVPNRHTQIFLAIDYHERALERDNDHIKHMTANFLDAEQSK